MLKKEHRVIQIIDRLRLIKKKDKTKKLDKKLYSILIIEDKIKKLELE